MKIQAFSYKDPAMLSKKVVGKCQNGAFRNSKIAQMGLAPLKPSKKKKSVFPRQNGANPGNVLSLMSIFQACVVPMAKNKYE